VIWRQRRYRSPMVERFLGRLRELAAEQQSNTLRHDPN
jgi:hypothetical protein